MSFADPRLQEDLFRLLRTYEGRIANLERKSMEDSPVGSLVQFAGKARSEAFSKTWLESVNNLDDHRWIMNNRVGTTRLIANAIGLGPSLTETVVGVSPVKFDEPGGLVSEGSYSVYFPGNGTRYDAVPAPFSQADTSWSIECLVKPRTQKDQMPVYVGDTVAANGYAIFLDAAGDVRLYMRGVVSQATGFKYKVGEWNHLTLLRTGNIMYMACNGSEYGPFTPASHLATITSKITIGADSAGGNALDGWIDRVTVQLPYVGYGPGVKNKYTGYDRYQAALVPSPPTGWVLADNTSVLKSEYARLWSVMKEQATVANSTATTFQLPSLSGNWIVKV